MVTERTTKQIIEEAITHTEHYPKDCICEKVWVLKEDVIKIIKNICYTEFNNVYVLTTEGRQLLNELNNPPDDFVSFGRSMGKSKMYSPPDENLTTNLISTSVLKKDTEGYANRKVSPEDSAQVEVNASALLGEVSGSSQEDIHTDIDYCPEDCEMCTK